MAKETEGTTGDAVPANDNAGPDRDGVIAPREKLDRIVLSIARMIGRRMAREDYGKAARAANDNKVPSDRRGQREDRSGVDDDE
ncbi:MULTISPECIES: hypothetical protein [Rhodopseudomonas]|nr:MULTISPECIES: hypothetical protein [Rhodopseudomonas]MDF3809958.1 hypothetical protein [Rhodopseudomonas sp. BAL398]WOK20482.1 hypothetical protein RBJ75_13595 [Rhodopseudomonas sp. BAL398]